AVGQWSNTPTMKICKIQENDFTSGNHYMDLRDACLMDCSKAVPDHKRGPSGNLAISGVLIRPAKGHFLLLQWQTRSMKLHWHIVHEETGDGLCSISHKSVAFH
ncbi:hypothetical protein AMECASPLE_031841, partial [Ameca splendens]